MTEEPPQQRKPKRSINEIFNELFIEIKDWFAALFDLQHGLSREGTVIAIKNNKQMRGANAWLLMCSIMIASLGLDLNSAAVIIGAMLISPLMAPILGIGLAVGTNDREALSISLKHFVIAILIALITSTFYFYITPLGQATEQILKRTSPNLLDSLVAVFGGLAGIISISRKDQPNAIPGVAIATALMPPLCVSGYGIANGNWTVMINAFYLFFLNSFFIALTTYIMIRVLKFPFKAHPDAGEARRTRIIIVIFSLFLIFPSAKILNQLYVYQKEKERAGTFVEDQFDYNATDFSYTKGDSSNQLIVELLGKTVPVDSLPYFTTLLDSMYNLKNTSLSIIQATNDLDKITQMQIDVSNLNKIAHQLDAANQEKSNQELKIQALVSRVDSLDKKAIPFQKICDELKVIFPKLNELGFATMEKTDFSNTAASIPVFIIKWDKNKTIHQKREDEKKLYDFLLKRANLDTLQIVSY